MNNSPLITGLVAFAAIVPSMLAYIPAGVLVDRWNPRRVMLVSELLRGLAIATVVISLRFFPADTSIWLLIAVMVVEEMLEIFSMLADRRCLSILVKRERIASSQASIEVRTHAVVLAGRPLGPYLFSKSYMLPFLADALSFLFSFGSILLIPRRIDWRRPTEKMSVRQLSREVREGFNWLWGDRRGTATIAFMAITSLIAQALIMMFLAEAHAKEISNVSIGVVLAASGAGGALGSVLARLNSKSIPQWWLLLQMAAWVVALEFLAMSGSLSVWWSAAAMSVLGFTGAIGNIEFGAYLVANAPGNMLARVTSIGQVLAIGACALGPILGGAAIQSYGPHGAIMTLLAIVTFSAVALAAFWLISGGIQAPGRHEPSGMASARISETCREGQARVARGLSTGDSRIVGPSPEAGSCVGGDPSFKASERVLASPELVDHGRYSNVKL